ncbi:alpha/beta fold hydrolase [Paenibacillus sp. NPDC057967]|uniref:alpha/beta fold hydrolase n=1 Tax=Paenibacillus sp. NPDC057967 TaxID=3346293 RepID=UPI0036D96EA1
MRDESMHVTPQPSLHFGTVQRQSNYDRKYQESLLNWPIPYTSSFVATRFGSTHVISCGPKDGEPLILLHAMGFSSTVWFPNIEVLAKKHRVYAIDYIGDLNKSAPTSIPSNLEECGEWLDDVLRELRLETFLLGGISYGGFLALNYTIYAPNRVRKLFLLSPAATFVPLHQTFINRIIAMAAIPMKWNVRRFMNWLSKHKLDEALVNQFHAAFRYGSLSLKVPPGVYSDDDLRNLQLPILLLLGDQEVISDAGQAYVRATQLCENIHAEMLPGVGHMMNLENPAEVNKRLERFLYK